MKKSFIADVLKAYRAGGNHFDGCMFSNIRNSAFYLVFACDEDEGLCGKIAYNCDDLKCDYEWDWQIPCDDNGRTPIYSECTELQEDTAETIDKWFTEIWDDYFKGNTRRLDPGKTTDYYERHH